MATFSLCVRPPDKIIETPTWIQVRVRYFGSHVMLWAAVLLLLNLGYNSLCKNILSIPVNQYNTIQYGVGYCRNLLRMELRISFLYYLILWDFFLRQKLNMWKKCSTERNTQTHLTDNSQKSYSWEASNLPQILRVGELSGWRSSYCLDDKWVVLQGFWWGSQWRQPYANPSSLTCPWSLLSAVCMGDSSMTSLFSISIINLKDPDWASDTICWSTDLALAKSSTKNSSLYHYLDEVLILVSINMIMHCRRYPLDTLEWSTHIMNDVFF